ncbi:MAG: hypothetical protein HUU34_03470 [Saprospiraceae bacterium]|jgi:hypothetical protein|nr:hypothetical protein [Saprospiraceae bacterium]
MKKLDESSYRQYTGKSEVHKAFNSLRGIIEGIVLDAKINQKEILELDKWCDNHQFLAVRNPFNDLIKNIQVIISDNEVTEEEINDMKWLCDKFAYGFDYYDDFTSDLQVLQGICHGILADGILKDDEIISLKKWLKDNSHLSTYYPYDEISSLISEVLSDNVIDENERKLLKKYFSEFVKLSDTELQEQIKEEIKNINIGGICSKVSNIVFTDNQFCFTGTSRIIKGGKGIEIDKFKDVKPGDFVQFWNLFKDKEYGHCGIVLEIVPNESITVYSSHPVTNGYGKHKFLWPDKIYFARLE